MRFNAMKSIAQLFWSTTTKVINGYYDNFQEKNGEYCRKKSMVLRVSWGAKWVSYNISLEISMGNIFKVDVVSSRYKFSTVLHKELLEWLSMKHQNRLPQRGKYSLGGFETKWGGTTLRHAFPNNAFKAANLP